MFNHPCVAVVVKNPSDFIGNVLGASESNTRAILATTAGKVLVIDEVRSTCCLAMFQQTEILPQGLHALFRQGRNRKPI
jgi:hypothetical protein